jgi:iron complex outermembrane receptor protein
LQASRDYSFCSLAARTAAQGGLGSGTPPRDFNCGGSSTSATGTFFTNVGTFQTQGNQFVPGRTLFNFGPYNFYQRPDERYTFGTFAEYEIAPGAKPYLEAMFMNDTSNSQIAPSGDFFNTTTINCDNPLLSTQQFNTICVPGNTFVDGNNVTQAIAYTGRRNVEGGGRADHLEHTAWRIVAGMKGDLLRGLSYDAYYQFGTTRLSQVYQNDFSVTRLRRALDVVADANGNPVCRSVLDGTDPACVPYNIFQTGGVTQAALDYLQIPLIQRGHVDETVANANFTLEGGEYGLQTPWSDRGVGLNVGAEYRKESLITEPDAEFQAGDGAGQGAPTLPVQCRNGVPVTQGGPCSFDVREAFAEVQIPIVSHSFIEEFTITGGYRYSDYKIADNHNSTNTYKIEAELAPVRDIKFRAGYNRAVRAPNVVELFTQQFVGLGGTVDPCAGAAVGGLVNGFTAAQCANTGVTAAQFGNIQPNSANQYNALFGGNVNLKPETADTYTAGVVLQPRWVPGLALTADYFDIKIKDLIGTLPFQTILGTCVSTGNPTLCALVNRAPGNGSLWLTPAGFVQTTNINVGGESTKGFDFNGSYAHKFGGMGTLNISFVGTLLDTLIFDTGVNPGTTGQNGTYDCAGLYGNTCGTPNPKYRHKLRVGFTLPNGLGISGQWRYFSKVKNDLLSNDCDITGNTNAAGGCIGPGTPAPANAEIKAQSYFDLALTARVADKLSLRIGANNLLDKSPPIVGGEVANAPFGNGNTYPQVYDALGRFLFAGVTVNF